MGFVAQTSQAIGELVGGDLGRGQDKFKQAFTTLATKPMLGYRGRVERKRQPRERLMGDAQYDETSAIRLSKSEHRRNSTNSKTTVTSSSGKVSKVEEDDEDDESIDDIDDDHDDGADEESAVSRMSPVKQGERGRDDARLWRCFDAAASLCLCWGKYVGHDVRANESHRMALSEMMIELGYRNKDAALVESDAQHQWDAVNIFT
jgi:hypothetical protein